MSSRKTGGGVENVYKAADRWVDCALRKDGSLFTPDEPIWTSQWLGELRERFLDRPDAGSGGFYQKLEQQLAGSPPEVYQLMGEVLYAQFLIIWKEGMKGETKKSQVEQVLGWGAPVATIPVKPINLTESLTPGIARSQALTQQRTFQVAFIIELVEQWKEQELSERDRLLTDPWAFKDFLRRLNFRSKLLRTYPNRLGAQREALLHIVHTDTFEGIVNTEYKHSIANSSWFAKYITESDDDVDRNILQIRSGLESCLRRDFDFYEGDVYSLWNPDSNPWDEFVRRAKGCVHAGQLESEEIQYKRKLSEDLANVREAVLAGAANWNNLFEDALTPSDTWRQLGLSRTKMQAFKKWCGDHPEDSLEALQALWVESALPVVERINALSGMLPSSALDGARARARTNVISVLLMGLDMGHYPPFRDKLFKGAYNHTSYDQPERDADEAGYYEHALGFLDRFIQEARQRELEIHNRLDAQTLVYAVVQERDCTDNRKETSNEETSQSEPDINSLADELTLPVKFLEEIEMLLDDKKQVIFQGPPGTGKTFVAQKLANHLAGSEDRVTLVQFHPPYSYEDFVQGFRPTILNSGQPGFKLMDGPLLRAAKSAEETDAKHFLIIDEINRGSLARILGELYFLLEYRDEKISLQYQSDTDEKFSLPDNLYIIGTMNTADRSIALVDLALRRRFYFVDFHPDDYPVKDVLRNWLNDNAPGMEWVAKVVDAANEELRDDRHAAIGPSYFMKSGLSEVMVERIWKHSVLPYIEERLFGEGEERIREFELDKLRPLVTSGSQPGSGSQGEDSAQDDGNTA